MPGLEGLLYDKVYDVSVGEGGILPDFIVVALPYDPDKAANPREGLKVLIWDGQAGFKATPFTVNEADRAVIVRTDRLGPVLLAIVQAP
jgi:hypothetical protein